VRRIVSVTVVLFVLAIAAGAVAAAGKSRSRIGVTLTAENHDPRPRNDPSWHWGYCVKVTTAAGRSVASTIHLQILSGRTIVRRVGFISLNKGYDHWCAAIGGEDNVLLAVPRGKKLIFQAVVRANGLTVTRNWAIVVQ
jgi:hypothetical protein